MTVNAISVISAHDMHCKDKVIQKRIGTETEFSTKVIFVELFIKTFGIILVCTLFIIPWTLIRRKDTIIYQDYWMEPSLPAVVNWMIRAGADLMNLMILTNENSLKSFNLYLKLSAMILSLWFVFYISSYLIWSVCLGYNHPLPYLGLMLLPTWMIWNFCLWFLLPTNMIKSKEFQRKLRLYMLYFI